MGSLVDLDGLVVLDGLCGPDDLGSLGDLVFLVGPGLGIWVVWVI